MAADMSDIDRLLTPLFRILAVAFAVTGLLFFAFPDGTIDTMNRVGSLFGVPDAPHLKHRFWLSLGTAYMAVVTVLAWRIAPAPSARRLLMEPLMIGKATSSLTCLLFALFDTPYFIYIANFVVDGALAGIVWWAWRACDPDRTPPTPARGLDARSTAILERIADAFLPPLPGYPADAASIDLGGRVAAHLCEQGAGARLGGTLLLRWINLLPLFLGRRRTLSRMATDERAETLDRMERSRWLAVRQPIVILKLLLGLHAYRHPDVQQSTGYDAQWLEDRLELARRRRATGEKGPWPIPEAPDALS